MISGDNLLLTQKTYSPIKDLVGETRVDLGIEFEKKKRLNSTIYQRSTGQLFSILAPCWDDLRCDMTHAFYTRRFDIEYPPTWKRLSQITANDFIGIPINLRNEVPKILKHKNVLENYLDDPLFWDTIGMNMGKSKLGKNMITIPNTYYNRVKIDRFKIPYKTVDKDLKLTYPPLAYMLHLFQDDNGNLVLPSFIIDMSLKNLTHLLRYIIKESEPLNDEYSIFKTQNKETVFTFAACIAKMYNTVYIIEKNLVPNQKEEYICKFSQTIKNNFYGLYQNGFLWYKPYKICKNSYSEDLYNVRNQEGKIFINGTIITV